MTFRHYMPMLFIGGQENWRPSPTVLATPLGDVRNGLIAAEDYAGLIPLVAWLWWALLLLSVTGVIRRVKLRP